MAWTRETMRPLAERFDERVRRDVSRFDRLIAPAHERGNVLRDPATEAEIAQAEERLGVRLPPSYRAFIEVANGAYASALGAEVELDDPDPIWRHGLLPVAEVQRTTDGDPLGVRIWCDESPSFADPAQDQPPIAGEPRMVRYYPPYRNGLLITHIHNGTNRLALVPRAGAEEWELWDFHWEGAMAHPSFADFLHWFVSMPHRRPKPEHADEMVEAFTEGTSYTLDWLAEIGDPRAVELARNALDEGSDDTRIPRLLGRIGDRENIPVLRDVYERSSSWTMRASALGALTRLGAADAHELLRGAASDPDPDLRKWARRVLETTRSPPRRDH